MTTVEKEEVKVQEEIAKALAQSKRAEETSAINAQEAARRAAIAAEKEEEASLSAINRALAETEAMEEAELIEAQKLAEAHYQMMTSADAAAGSGEQGGFAGLAGGAIKAEKAMSAIATGHGLGRVGGLLETLTSAAGLVSGTGLAIGVMTIAIEGMLPKLESWIEKMTGVAEVNERAAKALKEHNDQVERQQKAFEKLAEEPTAEEKAGAAEIKTLLGEGRATQVRQGIMQGLTRQQFELRGPREEFIRKMEAGELPQTPENLRRASELRTQQQAEVQEEANRLISELPTNQRAGSRIGNGSGAAGGLPRLHPRDPFRGPTRERAPSRDRTPAHLGNGRSEEGR